MSADLQCPSCLRSQDGEHEKRRSVANVIYLEWDETWDKRYAPRSCSIRDASLEERTPFQAFDYMRLPTELRFTVLEALIGPAIWPRAKVECRNCYADDNSSEPCYALLKSQGERSTIDDETIIYDSEDEELPALMSVSDIEKSETCVHVGPLENEPGGLASLAFQTAAWPKTIGIDIPYEVTKPTYGCRKPHQLGPDAFSTDGLSRKDSHWMRSLLLVSRQFSFEFQKMLWESTVKRYTRLHTMGASIPLLQSVKSSTGFNTLSRMALSISNSQLFRLLGFRSSWKRGFKPCTSSREVTLDILTNLNLDHLHFDFQIPKTPFSDETFSINDPWRHVHDMLRNTASCQRKFVDLFFVLAFDRLSNVPKVTFSGYFKERNLETWEEILAVSRKTLDYDMSSKSSTIMSMPADKFPLRCDCCVRCHHSVPVEAEGLGYTDGLEHVFEEL